MTEKFRAYCYEIRGSHCFTVLQRAKDEHILLESECISGLDDVDEEVACTPEDELNEQED